MPKPLAFIIEDDPKLSAIISITLDDDFELETCADGNTAMQRLETIVPKVVILDLNLPGLSGREILKHIRSCQRFAQTRVILTTADNRKADTLDNDADIVLLKPISPAQLRELVLRISSMP